MSIPLWLKYVLALCVFVPLAVVGVIYAREQTSAPPAESAAAVARSNQAALAEMQRDQAVHRATAARSLAPAVALERAILADVRAEIAKDIIAGPAGKVSCDQLRGSHADRLAFSCSAPAGEVTYSYRGVVQPRTRALAWCKDDNIAGQGELYVPLSPACT